ncbi:hypothetical protein L6164_010079 [Bauhinia variegata]|uniref:Uncharacterized protein n=1 Tax=Bauhinia variegata TaxID=167791 RepID=A0ACB9PLZ7_BAUVA|nr:hypothetical protein L6164_010079 [Bauhinia variegata]
MSQEKLRREGGQEEGGPIKYGDVFNVSGGLASKPIAPRDAAIMQSAETQVLGETQRGGPASLMQSAATINEKWGYVKHKTATNLGVAISETKQGGNRVITETLGGQVLGQYVEHEADVQDKSKRASGGDVATVGETAGSTVDEDAVATQAPQFKATGTDFVGTESGATLHPAILGDDNSNPALSHLSSVQEKRVPSENTRVITSVPGGMGASTVAADNRLKPNKY